MTSAYKKFEDCFRGPRVLIKDKLQVYLPFVQDLQKNYPNVPAIDLGCGRGEWLEILNEQGFPAVGVDCDAGMLTVCREYGLKVEANDALSFLKELQDESCSLISAFHVIEHVPYSYTEELIHQAVRSLKPHGILILETPNIENILVGLHSFYADPTHISRMNSALLEYWLKTSGFELTKKLYLPLRGPDNGNLSISDVLFGCPPDFGIVAQKKADAQMMPDIALAFSKDYGAGLSARADRFDQLLLEYQEKNAHLDTVRRDELQRIHESLKDLKVRAKYLEEDIVKNLGVRVKHLEEDVVKDLNLRINEQRIFIERIRSSLPWRVTRFVYRRMRSVYGGIKDMAKKSLVTMGKTRIARFGIRKTAIAIRRFPALEDKTKRILSHFPWIKQKLRSELYRSAMEAAVMVDVDPEELSPRAKAVYKRLESAHRARHGNVNGNANSH